MSFEAKLEDVNTSLKAHLAVCKPCKKAHDKTTHADRSCKEGHKLCERADELLVFILLP